MDFSLFVHIIEKNYPWLGWLMEYPFLILFVLVFIAVLVYTLSPALERTPQMKKRLN